MTNNVAYIISRICTITGHSPVKKALQKTIYLLEEKGVQLGFDYVLHFYGPYCAELDDETKRLSSEGVIHFEYCRYGHKIKIDPEYEASLETDLSEPYPTLIQRVIERYKDKSPSELELLTTAIYAYKHTDGKTRDGVAANVKKIKGKKYGDQEIAWALNEFPYFEITL